MSVIRIVSAYGRLRVGTEYKVIGEGRDYVSVQGGGTVVHVPNHMIERPEDVRRARRDEREDRDEDEMESYN